MSAISRLQTALDDALLKLPEGHIHVMRPTLDYDMAALGDRSVTFQHTLYPLVQGFQDAGYELARLEAIEPAAVIVVVPRDKALARDLIARAAATGALVVVDGQKTDGVESLFKAARKILGPLPSLTKAHGRLFWMTPGHRLDDWRANPPSRKAHGYVTTVGIFSADSVDEGSALLAKALPPKLPRRVADLGAGWGFLATAILDRDGVQALDLVEADSAALDCARLNITDERVQFVWADATAHDPEHRYDAIVMNPPFHSGRESEPALGRNFIDAAARMLSPGGHLWMVANRHLPYETRLREQFKTVEELPGSGAFKLFHASRPSR